MRKRNIAVWTMLAAIFLSTGVQAQDFSTKTIGRNYLTLSAQRQLDDFDKQIESILLLFSSLVGSGFVHTASLHSVGGIDVGLRSVFAVVPDEFQNIVQTPQDLPDPLQEANVVPLPFLHASLGLPANFEVTGKFFSFPLADNPDENITLIGGALKYGLLEDNLSAPAITLLAGYQAILVPDEYSFGTVSTLSVKGYISKGLTGITIYGGGGLDRTTLKLDIPGIITKDYDVNYTSGTVGITIAPLPLLKINADFNIGKFRNVTAGVLLNFR
jgi:hypothetical protein